MATTHSDKPNVISSRRWKLSVVTILSLVGISTHASDDLLLSEKADLFQTDIEERFLQEGQLRVRRRLPTTDHPFVTYNMSDTAYMTGLYCATSTWRYLATRDPDAAAQARSSAAALMHLVSVTEVPGLLARASVPIDTPWFDDGTWRQTEDGRHRWRGNVSSDQVDALVFGLYIYSQHLASSGERNTIGRTIGAIVDTIVDNNHRIVGYDGQPTRWGRYDLDYVTNSEPMNALLLLQMVKVAHALTNNPHYEREYQRLVDMGYAHISEAARVDDPPLEANHSDDVLIALALYPLLELEREDGPRRHYLEAALRWFRGGRHPGIDAESNPFATFLYRHWTGENEGFESALNTLRQVPLDMKWNPDTIESYTGRFGFTFAADPFSLPTDDGPFPISQRGRTWSFLVHNPYRIGGNRLEAAPFETNGLDFLLSYWFGRAHGMIPLSQ